MTASDFPRAVVFDWDNTLVDSWSAIARAINYVRAKYGQPTWSMPEIMANCTRSARESFPDWFGDRWPAAWTDYYAYFEKIRGEIGITPLNGAAELLAWLKGQGIPCVVVSNKSDKYLQQEAALLGWGGFFAAICGAHTAVKDKPAREHVDHALSLAGLTADAAVWFIGDSEADVVCARNAGCTPVLLAAPLRANELQVALNMPDCDALLGLLSARRRAIA